MWRQQLNNRKAGLIITQINIFLKILILGFGEVDNSRQGQQLLLLRIVILNQFRSLEMIKEINYLLPIFGNSLILVIFELFKSPTHNINSTLGLVTTT